MVGGVVVVVVVLWWWCCGGGGGGVVMVVVTSLVGGAAIRASVLVHAFPVKPGVWSNTHLSTIPTQTVRMKKQKNKDLHFQNGRQKLLSHRKCSIDMFASVWFTSATQ